MQVTDSAMFVSAPVVQPRNTLAIVASCIAVLGLLALCLPQFMLLSTLALLLGLIALFKRPRSFALLALLLAMLGLGLGTIHLTVRWLAQVTTRFVQHGATKVQNTFEATQIATAIEAYRYDNAGLLPADLATLKLPMATILDAWGAPYIYEPSPDNKSYRLLTAGPDRKQGTHDDLDLTNVSSLEPYLRDAVPMPALPPNMRMPHERMAPPQEKQRPRSSTPGPA
jgi:hypothetical protein